MGVILGMNIYINCVFALSCIFLISDLCFSPLFFLLVFGFSSLEYVCLYFFISILILRSMLLSLFFSLLLFEFLVLFVFTFSSLFRWGGFVVFGSGSCFFLFWAYFSFISNVPFSLIATLFPFTNIFLLLFFLLLASFPVFSSIYSSPIH
ncbi:hypothetical protein ES288_D10G313400v1 [Gossypium darwinii]|uniref:Uncharacterized protein n=1 Tax=Gossypium darwinii TaxID=34276 RepID=A0A5D2B6Z8_GOSDA|nr:hypothetical protein ES288_D10G313400v1 [Gossypium darwinii]